MDSAPDGDHVLLDIQDLRTHFVTDEGTVAAVDGVSLSVGQGQTVALVGETGCGKSVTALSVLRLIPSPPGRIVGGRIWLHDADGGPSLDLITASESRMRRIRGHRIAMVFQEPMTSLNPVLPVGQQIAEAILAHRRVPNREAWDRATELLRQTGIPDPEQRVHDYPHRMSGGMQQRAMIAMALSCEPSLLIADEPTTALDVTVQAQILDLLRQVQAERSLAIVLITHDLGVVAQMADEVYVMYAGRIVERAPVEELFAHPLHPYTQGLMNCLPRGSPGRKRLQVIPGHVPDPAHPPRGCRFHPRCEVSAARAAAGARPGILVDADGVGAMVLRRCVEPLPEEPGGEPTWRELRPNHFVACWEAEEGV
jgi:oligopeptide/dipeptide ABC transporter ATP-binding protein